MFKKTLFLLASTTLLSACATNIIKTPSPMSGSKADGTVVMAYTYSVNPWQPEIPTVDWEGADKIADQKCIAWGYNKAERFGEFINEKCNDLSPDALTGALTCKENIVKVEYQCLD